MQLGRGRIPFEDVERRVDWYRREVGFGPMYYDEFPEQTDLLTGSDLAFGAALGAWNGLGLRLKTFQTVRATGDHVISDIPMTPLSRCTDPELEAVAAGLSRRRRDWHGFGVSTVSKTIHRRRRATVPVLDRTAISGAYMSPDWRPTGKSPKGVDPNKEQILATLQHIAADLNRPSNAAGWQRARQAWPQLEDVELFDVLWWSVWWNA